MTHEQKKNLINKKIDEGDKRSYNEIQADIELQLWQENKSMFPFSPFSLGKNNRKRTKGRIIQSAKIFDKPKEDTSRKVIAHKQVKHQLPIN